MTETKYLYWAYQSSQEANPTEEQLKSFQNKYKKDFKTRELFTGEELLEEYRLRSWKHPRYSKIISIILAFEVNGELRMKYITGEEKDLLQEFSNILRNNCKEYTIVGFDSQITLPYLGIRMIKNGFLKMPHKDLDYANGKRPWDLTGIDLQRVYDGAGNYKSSLKDIAGDLGLDHETIIEVEDEFYYHESGKYDELKTSAIQKVSTMSNAHRMLLGLDTIPIQLIEEKVKDVSEEKPKDWMVELVYSDEFTDEIKEGLREKIFGGKKKPTKKELVDIKRIILAHYQKKGDKVDVKKHKEEYVNSLVDEWHKKVL